MAVKIGTMFGALLVLIIIISIARSLFSGGGNTQALTDVAQEQQAMIHVLTNDPGEGSRQVTLSPDNQTFAATAKTSLTSAQQQLVIYMTNNHKKIDVNALEENTNPAIDEQLTAAVDNSTYDSTFKQVMQSQLTKYQKALQAAYQKTDGPIGRKLLSDEFDDAKLLLTQLNSPSS